MHLPRLSSVQRQYLAAFSCQLSVMMIGTCFAWFTPLLSELSSPDSRIPMTSTQSSWMIASIEIGEIISPLPAGLLVNRWGRKVTLLTSFPMTALSWALVLTTKSYEALLIVRILQGFAMGVIFTVAPIYLAEISQPKIRGAICGLFQTFWVMGVLYAFVTGPFLSYEYYAVAGASVAVLFLLTFSWAPETPYFLLMKNREAEARKSLIKLRGSEDIEREISSIKMSLENEKSHKGVRWKDLVANKDSRRALAVVSGVCFVKYMSGTVAITEYVSLTVSETTGSTISEHWITIGIGSVMLAASLTSAYLSDNLGRKPLIFVSVVGAMVFNAITGTYFLLLQYKTPNIESCSWVAYVSLGAYCVIANVGLSPLLQTLQAECFPSRLRGHAGAFVSFIGTIFIFLSLKQYQPVTDWIGVYFNFYTFSIYAIIGSIAIFAFMKETAGKSLAEIQEEKKTSEPNQVGPEVFTISQ